MPDSVSRDVGRRLRAVRMQQGLSIEDVEKRSGGQWSASSISAYERGSRTLSIERLRALADFYGVPVSVLLGTTPKRRAAVAGSRVVLDLEVLAAAGDEMAPVTRLARSIQVKRNDFNGKMLSLRNADVANLAMLYGCTEQDLINKLAAAGVLVEMAGDLVAASGDDGDENGAERRAERRPV